jgi:hypothetical protein
MCYFLYIASPLTLTEVRSMLPAGAKAELASYSDQQGLKSLHPSAQTVARILVGRCSCDLVRDRLRNTREDERHLRQRYRAIRLSRTHVIELLSRHRVDYSRADAANPSQWPEALAGFVAEHARNAGPTLYLLHFGFEGPKVSVSRPAFNRLHAGQVRLTPREWLVEGMPTLVY